MHLLVCMKWSGMKKFLIAAALAVHVVSSIMPAEIGIEKSMRDFKAVEILSFEEKIQKQLCDEHLVSATTFFSVEENAIFKAQTAQAGCHTMFGCWVSKVDNAFGAKLYTIEINNTIVPVLCIEKKIRKKSKNRLTNPKTNFFVIREIMRYAKHGIKSDLTPSQNRAIDIAVLRLLDCKTCIKQALNSWWVTGWDIFVDVLDALASDYNTYHTVNINKKINRMNHNSLIPDGSIWGNQKFIEGYIKDQRLPKKCDVCCPKKEKKAKAEKVKPAKKVKKAKK